MSEEKDIAQYDVITVPHDWYNHLLRNVRGSYSHTEWGLVDVDGELCEDNVVAPGRHIVMENAYDSVVLYVGVERTPEGDAYLTLTRVVEESK